MAQELNTLIDFDLNNFRHLDYLREHLYPAINQSLEILIDQLIKTNEVQSHQERLKQKKIRDRLEQKRIEKEKLKEELGSDYVSSSDEEESVKEEPLEKPSDEDINLAQEPLDTQKDELDEKLPGGKLAPIQEEEDIEPSPDKLNHSSPEESKENTLIQDIFNPIEFLGMTLKKIKNGEILSPATLDLNRSKSNSQSISKNIDTSLRTPY